MWHCVANRAEKPSVREIVKLDASVDLLKNQANNPKCNPPPKKTGSEIRHGSSDQETGQLEQSDEQMNSHSKCIHGIIIAGNRHWIESKTLQSVFESPAFILG